MKNSLVNGQHEQKVKRFKGHDSHIEHNKVVIQTKVAMPSIDQSSKHEGNSGLTKEIMEAKAALPSDSQTRKHEDHTGLTEDEQKRIEAVANEKGSDSENQACAHPSESVLEKHGLFHQEENAHSEQNTAEADVEELETGHAAMSLVLEHELWALKSGLNEVLDTTGLLPPWVDTQFESEQFLTDDKVLTPQTFDQFELDQLLTNDRVLVPRRFNQFESGKALIPLTFDQSSKHEGNSGSTNDEQKLTEPVVNEQGGDSSNQAHANPDVKDQDGKTALMEACMIRGSVIVSRSIEAGSDMDVTDNDGKTALMIACDLGFHPRYQRNFSTDGDPRIIVKQLIATGADVNASDKNGKTALMIACMTNCYWLVSELLKAGADVNARDNRGMTVFDYSYNYGGSQRMMDILNKVPGSGYSRSDILHNLHMRGV